MPQPTKIPRPFAASGDKNNIPDSSGSIGFASWQEGFPAITSEPFAQGGVAPKRADFNGIFNALSAGLLWLQQGGVYAYDNTTDYEVGNLAAKSGVVYICKTANGPSSTVKDPAADTAETYWARLYPQSGTFSRMFFSQTSGNYIAPYTGVYKITLKGGGGGGGGRNTNHTYTGGSGGGEGGTLIFYVTLTKSQSYAYTIGAGGTAGTNGAGTQTNGSGGGATKFTLSGTASYQSNGGSGGPQSGNLTKPGGRGGSSFSAPSGAVCHFIPGAPGMPGAGIGSGGGLTDFPFYAAVGGGSGGGCAASGQVAIYGGGGAGSSGASSNPPAAQNGGDGYILIEYAG